MNDLAFVDTHIHFNDFDQPQLRWDWLDPDAVHPILGDINGIKHRRYIDREFHAETRFSNVTKVVHVQAALGTPDPVSETAWLQEMADRSGVPQCIVAEAHLQQPDVERTIERQVEFGNVRGIRNFAVGDYLVDPDFERGFSLLARYGLLLDLDTTWEQMGKARALAERHPDTFIVIDHCGFPRERTPEYFENWRHAVRDVSGAPNIWLKISGLGMCDPLWTVDSFRPWVEECLESFGGERCIFGTNWPVDRLYSSYPDLVAAYRELIAQYSPSEQVALFSANAERLFRI